MRKCVGTRQLLLLCTAEKTKVFICTIYRLSSMHTAGQKKVFTVGISILLLLVYSTTEMKLYS
jgi:hypothetical protein